MDGGILIHELIHYMSKYHSKGLPMKLDMKKAFDKINWAFLLKNLASLLVGSNGFLL